MILIKDMKMPDCCYDCPFSEFMDIAIPQIGVEEEKAVCVVLDETIVESEHLGDEWVNEKRADFCPLIEWEMTEHEILRLALAGADMNLSEASKLHLKYPHDERISEIYDLAYERFNEIRERIEQIKKEE